MSAWEGSVWQEQQQTAAESRRARLDCIRRENPSLSDVDAELWLRQLEAQERPPSRCCACRSRRAREVVRLGEYLGACHCICHEALPPWA